MITFEEAARQAKERALRSSGGPAFPTGTGVTPYNPGMTLRDYFAAKAMQGMLQRNTNLDLTNHEATVTAEASYYMADQMLKARAQ